MKESYWGYWLIMLGVFIVVVMMFTQDATTSSTQDYYQLKEVANADIYDSIDYAYYSQTKQVRMLKEVFVENFIRRFAETVSMTDTYQIVFSSNVESVGWVEIDGRKYQELAAGSQKSRSKVHKIVVPHEALNNAKSYSIHTQKLIYRGPFGGIWGKEISENYNKFMSEIDYTISLLK